MDYLMNNKDKQIITIAKDMCLAFFEEIFDQNMDEQSMIQDTKNPDMCLAFMNKCYDGVHVTSILAVSNRILALMDLAVYKFRCVATEWNVLVMKAASALARAMAEVLENATLGELWIWWLVALRLAMHVSEPLELDLNLIEQDIEEEAERETIEARQQVRIILPLSLYMLDQMSKLAEAAVGSGGRESLERTWWQRPIRSTGGGEDPQEPGSF